MQNLKFDIAPNDIERSHRIGQLKQPGEKQRRVKVNLVLYNHRNMIFRYQKKVKSKKKKNWIAECLTASRMENLEEARELLGFRNVRTIDGNIFCKFCDNPQLCYG